MSYNPDAMTIIVSGDLPPEMAEKLKTQLTADVLTANEFAEREKALEMQQQVEHDTEQNRVDAGLEEGGDDFQAPDEASVDNVDVTDTSGDNLDTGTEGEGEADAEPETTEDDSDVADIDEVDNEELTEEDQSVKDELDEPNAALEHAQSVGTKEVGRLLRLGVGKYKRRVRRKRAEQLKLAQETLQMDDAQRQKLIRRLLYVKPTDSGFTSKLQTFISTLQSPQDWIALIDTEGSVGDGIELTKQQIKEALEKAGVQMFENVETLADTFNQVQKSITEPAGTQQDDAGLF